MPVYRGSTHIPEETFKGFLPIETNLARKGIFVPGRGRSLPSKIEREDFLGLTAAEPPLRLVDLEIIGWLSQRLTVDNSPIRFTLYELADDLFATGTTGGRYRAMAREGLLRLKTATLTLDGYALDQDALVRVRSAQSATWSDVHILDELRLPSVSSLEEMVSIGGSREATCSARLAPWLAHQLKRGYLTFMNWHTMRQLNGVAKRLWVYLNAEQYRIARSDDPDFGDIDLRRSQTSISVGPKLAAALGVSYSDPVRFRAQVRKAFTEIREVDPQFEEARFFRTRTGGWRVEILREDGPRGSSEALRRSLFAAARSFGLMIGSERRRFKEPPDPWHVLQHEMIGVAVTDDKATRHVATGPLRFFLQSRRRDAWRLREDGGRMWISGLQSEYGAYRAWVESHPDGVVLRLHGTGGSFRGSRLHRASCPVIKREPRSRRSMHGDTRVCSSDLSALLDWWVEEADVQLADCARCRIADPWVGLHPAFQMPRNPDQQSILDLESAGNLGSP